MTTGAGGVEKKSGFCVVHLFLPPGASRFSRSRGLMRAVTDAARGDGG